MADTTVRGAGEKRDEALEKIKWAIEAHRSDIASRVLLIVKEGPGVLTIEERLLYYFRGLGVKC